MSAPRPRLTVWIDASLPLVSFRTLLEGRGHHVDGVGEGFPSGSPDQSVLTAGDHLGAVVITSGRDWRQLVKQVGAGGRGRFRRTGRILFDCDHSIALRRWEDLIDDIEREHQLCAEVRALALDPR